MHFQGRQLCYKCFCSFFFENESTLNENNLWPVRVNYFLFESILFQTEIDL